MKSQGIQNDLTLKPLSTISLLFKLMFLPLDIQPDPSPISSSSSSSIHTKLILQPHQYLKAITKFNNEDKSFLTFLSHCGLLSQTPTPFEVAHFLRSSSLLDKKQIGEYLGKNKDFNKEVLTEYVKSFDFRGTGLLSSLRMFLESFRLPGESQQIDRIVEVWIIKLYIINSHSLIMLINNAVIIMN